VLERGRHVDLVNRPDGLYSRLFALQTRDRDIPAARQSA
jgi:hypothetical protein